MIYNENSLKVEGVLQRLGIQERRQQTIIDLQMRIASNRKHLQMQHALASNELACRTCHLGPRGTVSQHG